MYSAKRLYYFDELDAAEGRRQLLPIPWSTDGEAWDAAKTDVGETRLESSRTPILDAFLTCAIRGWGVHLLDDTPAGLHLRVTDFSHSTHCASLICAKAYQTQDEMARLKALARWFPTIRQQLEAARGEPFELCVTRPPTTHRKYLASFHKLQGRLAHLRGMDAGGEELV